MQNFIFREAEEPGRILSYFFNPVMSVIDGGQLHQDQLLSSNTWPYSSERIGSRYVIYKAVLALHYKYAASAL